MSEDMDKLFDRIRKLLALGKNNSNENEANIAIQRAHKLLAKYNLSLSDIPENERDAQDPYVTEEKYQPNFQGSAAIRVVYSSIGKLYFCKVWRTNDPKKGDTFHFAGRRSNATIAKEIAESVVAWLRKECTRQDVGLPGFKTSFINAASTRVGQRCADLLKQAQEGELQDEEGNNFPALRSTYLAETDAVDAYLESLNVKLRKGTFSPRGGIGDGAAHGAVAGRQAGNRVPLRMQVNRPSVKALGKV